MEHANFGYWDCINMFCVTWQSCGWEILSSSLLRIPNEICWKSFSLPGVCLIWVPLLSSLSSSSPSSSTSFSSSSSSSSDVTRGDGAGVVTKRRRPLLWTVASPVSDRFCSIVSSLKWSGRSNERKRFTICVRLGERQGEWEADDRFTSIASVCQHYSLVVCRSFSELFWTLLIYD